MTGKALIESVNGKRIPSLGMQVKWADLYLQEEEILKSFKDCDTLEKVNDALDKCVLYVALTKNILQGFDD